MHLDRIHFFYFWNIPVLYGIIHDKALQTLVLRDLVHI